MIYKQNINIISAFPGTGKTYLFEKMKAKGINVYDSDSSKFDKQYFPDNYINYIKSHITEEGYMFVSSHKNVRDSMIDNNIDFKIAIPELNNKQEYINRYIQRGSSESFIKIINDNYEFWINEIINDEKLKNKIMILKKNEFLIDFVEKNE